ncbi:PLDc N-terminal domain-containing protein [Spirosoma luteum]|uniref:PLDc N-terminal domain-containing protein n=1 Tax=Spirosoma luteum TaxID=431553 RepID=UPI000360D05C|nr:PLDc N-terminal domain-containing protein [Spirosoma luteum]
MYTLIGIGVPELILILLAGAVVFLLPIMALVDVVRSEFRGQNDKVIWVIVILFLNIIGAALYFFIGRNQRIS